MPSGNHTIEIETESGIVRVGRVGQAHKSPLTTPERTLIYQLVKNGFERPEVIEKVRAYRVENGLPEIETRHISQTFTSMLKGIRRDTEHYRLSSPERKVNRRIIKGHLEDFDMLSERIRRKTSEDPEYITTDEFKDLWDRKVKLSEIIRKISEQNEAKKQYRRPGLTKPDLEPDYSERVPQHLLADKESKI